MHVLMVGHQMQLNQQIYTYGALELRGSWINQKIQLGFQNASSCLSRMTRGLLHGSSVIHTYGEMPCTEGTRDRQMDGSGSIDVCTAGAVCSPAASCCAVQSLWATGAVTHGDPCCTLPSPWARLSAVCGVAPLVWEKGDGRARCRLGRDEGFGL
jgi:hypothetical protein